MKINKPATTSENNEGGFDTYTGLTRAKIVAVNPNLKELEKIGVKLQEEPEYRKVINSENKYIVTFWLQSLDNDKLFKLEFPIDKSIVKNRDNTKTKMIDKFGRTCWTTNVQTMSDVNRDYFDVESGRPCRTMEEEINNFIRNYNGLKTKEEGLVNLENIFQNPKLVVKDLQDSETGLYSWDINNIWLFATASIVVKDGKRRFYQRVLMKFYNGAIPYKNVLGWFTNFIEKQGTYIKDYYEIGQIKAIDKSQFGPVGGAITPSEPIVETNMNISSASEDDNDLPF